MKALITGIGICVLLLAGGPAYAADDFGWTGASTSLWDNAANWTGPARDYPGMDNAGDTATIEDDTQNPVTLSSSLSNSIASLTLNADTNDKTVSFTHSTGTNTATSSVDVIASDSADNTATFLLTSGTFDPAAVTLWGGGTSARKALFDLNGGTLTAPDSMLMYGVSEIDSEISFTVDDTFNVYVHADDTFDTFATLDMGSYTLTQSGHVTIQADQSAGYDATLEISAGTVNVASGKTTKIEGGGSADDAVATLKLSGAMVDPADLYLSGGESAVRRAFLDLDSGTLSNPDTFRMQGYVEIDSEISFTVDGAFTVDRDSGDDFNTFVTVDMNDGTMLSVAGSLIVGATGKQCTLDCSAGAGELKTIP